MELGHLLTRSGLTYPEVSSKFYHDSFCQLGSSISLPWVIYFEAFYLQHVRNYNYLVNLLYIRLSILKFVKSIKSGFVFNAFYFAAPSTLLPGATAPLPPPRGG